jgi:hypothetical protein
MRNERERLSGDENSRQLCPMWESSHDLDKGDSVRVLQSAAYLQAGHGRR